MKKRVLITDIDNTLFDWFAMWHSSFSVMMAVTSDISKVALPELLDAAKIIHQKYGTTEYAFLLEEIPQLISKYGSRESIRQNLKRAVDAYRICRHQLMTPYPGVISTLTAIRESGGCVLAFSESKSYYSSYRIRELGLDGVVDIVFCPQDHVLPQNRKPSVLLARTKCQVLPVGFKKPDPLILLEILSDAGFAPSEALYVGDSKVKDIRMSIDAGVDYLWYKSGASHLSDRPEEYDLLRRVTHWTPAEVELERKLSADSSTLAVSPQRTIHNYADVLRHFV